jgi:hypothetical protein
VEGRRDGYLFAVKDLEGNSALEIQIHFKELLITKPWLEFFSHKDGHFYQSIQRNANHRSDLVVQCVQEPRILHRKFTEVAGYYGSSL